jgi:hypothetical protein
MTSTRIVLIIFGKTIAGFWSQPDAARRSAAADVGQRIVTQRLAAGPAAPRAE